MVGACGGSLCCAIGRISRRLPALLNLETSSSGAAGGRSAVPVCCCRLRYGGTAVRSSGSLRRSRVSAMSDSECWIVLREIAERPKIAWRGSAPRTRGRSCCFCLSLSISLSTHTDLSLPLSFSRCVCARCVHSVAPDRHRERERSRPGQSEVGQSKVGQGVCNRHGQTDRKRRLETSHPVSSCRRTLSLTFHIQIGPHRRARPPLLACHRRRAAPTGRRIQAFGSLCSLYEP